MPDRVELPPGRPGHPGFHLRVQDLLALGDRPGQQLATGLSVLATGVLFATSQEKAHLIIEPTPTSVGVAVLGRF